MENAIKQASVDLMELLKSQGIQQGEKKRTAKNYTEPTIEFYKSGGVRLRGVSKELASRPLVFKVTAQGILFFTAETSAQAKATAEQMGIQAYTGKERENPNIKLGASITQGFYQNIKAHSPDMVKETGNGGVASAPLSVEQLDGGTLKLEFKLSNGEA